MIEYEEIMENSDNLSNSLKVIIPNGLPDLNQYIKAINGSRFTGNTMKQDMSNFVAYEAMNQTNHMTDFFGTIIVPAFFEFHWYCKNKKKDKDNICGAGKKFILDGLQHAGVIAQDNWNAVIGFSDHFYIDSENPRVEVIIKY